MMFLLAAVGYLMYKSGKITEEGSKALGNILLYLSLPCVIVNSFLIERTPDRTAAFLISALIALLALLLSMLVSRVMLKKNAIDIIAAAYSNAGFFGIPLTATYLSSEAVFYIAPFIAFLNLFQWTYGVSLLKGSDKDGHLKKRERSNKICSVADFKTRAGAIIKKVVTAPFMIAITIGCLIFFSGVSLPPIFAKSINHIANLNTPVAMFTVGIYMAHTDIGKMFKRRRLYYVSLVRLIIIPVLTILALSLISNNMLDMKLAILIAAACPVGANVAVYAQLHNKEYSYAVETVVISTILSIISIPLMVAIGEALWI